MRFQAAVTALATASALATVLPSAPAHGAGPPSITWGVCPDVELTGLECGTIPVPLAHNKPTDRQIVLEVSRLKASGDPAAYLGPLVVNFGGPGGTGMDAGLYLAGVVPKEILDRYDIIGFDPRGIGMSSPSLVCDPDPLRGAQPAYEPPDLRRIRGGERSRLEAVKAYVAQCGERNGDLLRHMRTTDVARDIDLIRQALEAPKLNYLGYSYGTYIGQVYATLFPDHVGRFVLDGNVAPTGVGYEGDLGRPDAAKAFDRNVRRFFSWTAKYSGVYQLGSTEAEVAEHYYATRNALAAHPVDGIGPAEWVGLFAAAVYVEAAWPLIAQVWAAFDQGQTKMLTDSLVFAAKEADAAIAGSLAVICSDGPWPASYRRIRDVAAATAKVAPFSTWALFWYETVPCSRWPVHGKAARVGSSDAAPILFVNGTLDAPTQFPEALAARRAFHRSVLLAESGGADHAGSTFAKNACIDAIVNAYLLQGTLPQRKTGDGPDVSCARKPEPGLVEIATVAAMSSLLENLPPEVVALLPEVPASYQNPAATLGEMLLAAWTNTRHFKSPAR
ncbi:MAG TPA: alpha/beta fold hydrolase [Sporichthya sp.]|nr:alpha/beta fold hydrolase [Sporichthya sp.]